jgi:hypothetical protein
LKTQSESSKVSAPFATRSQKEDDCALIIIISQERDAVSSVIAVTWGLAGLRIAWNG